MVMSRREFVTHAATAAALPDIAPQPQFGVTLQYADAPAPRYPPRALREGRSGLVVLEVLVDVDGQPIDVAVAQSSGHRDLDRAIEALDLCLQRGETFALVGESGCGKSMAALALMRLLPDIGRIVAGRVQLAGTELLALPESAMRSVRGGRIGIHVRTAGMNVAIGVWDTGVGIAPAKLPHVLALRAKGAKLAVILDNVEAARAVAVAEHLDLEVHRLALHRLARIVVTDDVDSAVPVDVQLLPHQAGADLVVRSLWPGAAELGDFDATSTTIGVTPGGLQGTLPDTALRRTFERYVANSRARATAGMARLRIRANSSGAIQ